MSLLTIASRAESSLSRRVLTAVEPHITRRHKSEDARKPVQSSYILLHNRTTLLLTDSVDS